MKTKILATLLAVSLVPSLGFAQNPQPNPPVPPVPAVKPPPPPDRDDDDDNDRAPKVPITFLGVETSDVPSVVAEQLGLAKGFGLVVDYVVPDGPAAAAGVQQNDILKMLNDQILTEPDQLGKLIRSMSEGTSVTLTILRKGAETRLTVRLGKKEVRQRRGMRGWRHGKGFGYNFELGPEFEQKMEMLGEKLANMNFSGIDEKVIEEAREQAREQAREARRQAREGVRQAREGAREAARAAREAARAFRFDRRDDGTLKTTRIDMNRAQIVYHDDQGELKLENVSGKKILTAKDPQDRTIFSGPVDTKEDLDKLPPEVRQRYDKLEQKDLPALAPPAPPAPDAPDAIDNTPENDADDSEDVSVLQVSCPAAPPASATAFDLNIVLI